MSNNKWCTVKRVCKETNESAQNVKKVTINGTDITTIEDLAECASLEKVDLSKNDISDAKGLCKCISISWLNLSHNFLTSMEFVSGLKRLTVLNLGYNKITDTSFISNLRSLKALILNNNKIADVAGLEQLTHLNTLVLSHNKLEEIEVGTLSSLVKLQLSHNALKSFPDIRFNVDLKNLMLNENSIKTIPDDYVADVCKLEIVEIGSNRLSKLKDIRALSRVKSLVRLNVSGNTFCNEPDYITKIRSMFRTIKILNAQPIHKIRQSVNHVPKVSGESEELKSSEFTGSDHQKDTEKASKKGKRQREVSPSDRNVCATQSGGVSDVITDGAPEDSAPPSDVLVGKKKREKSKKAERVIDESHNSGTDNDAAVSTGGVNNNTSEVAKKDVSDDAVATGDVSANRLSKKRKTGVPALKDKNSGVLKVIEVSKSKRPFRPSTLDIREPEIGDGVKDDW